MVNNPEAIAASMLTIRKSRLYIVQRKAGNRVQIAIAIMSRKMLATTKFVSVLCGLLLNFLTIIKAIIMEIILKIEKIIIPGSMSIFSLYLVLLVLFL